MGGGGGGGRRERERERSGKSGIFNHCLTYIQILKACKILFTYGITCNST